MKKFVAIVLALVLVLALVACGTPAETPATDAPATDAPATEKPAETPAAPAEAEYKLGMGVVVSTASSKTGLAQVDATVATVVTDKDGKIVSARIDVAQNKMTVEGGAVDTAATYKTKMELGTAYGMAGKVDNNDDGVMLEWDEQAKAFEAYVVGKTGAEVAKMETKEAKGHQIAVDEALLKAGCSMQITDFMAAVAAACEDAQAMTFKTADAFTLGVAATTVANESKAATADAEGLVAMYTDFAATVIGKDGKILACINDAIQPKIAVNAAGEIGTVTYVATKRNLKEDYNMAKFGATMDPNADGKVLEWYLQSEAFSKHVVGKTGAEVGAMETATNSIGYQMTTDAALLSAGCTIQITSMTAVTAAAAANAR